MRFLKGLFQALGKQITIGTITVKVGTVIAATATVLAVGGTTLAVTTHFNATVTEESSNEDKTVALDDEKEQDIGNSEEDSGFVDENNNPIEISEEDVHEHVFTTEIISESTCTEHGTAVDTCECGYSNTYSLPLKEHTPDKIEVVTEATETADGLQNVYCSVCGTLIRTEVIPVIPHEHNYVVSSETHPTCMENGNKHYVCSVCGSYYDETVPATGHHYTFEYAEDSTCAEEGHIYQKCEYCGEVIETGTIAKKEHEFGTWVSNKEATCTENGQQKHICKNCGYEETGDVAALGHDWIEKEVVDSTCSEEGNRKYECSRCGETKIEAIDKKAHTETDWIPDSEPTCTGTGSKHKECTVCGAITETKVIPATGHTWSDWEVSESDSDTYAATCEATGVEARTCSVCGEKETRVIPALGHSYEDVIDIAVTCTTDGEKHQKCTVCGHETEHETVPATGHSFTQYEETVAPTDLTVGKEVATCDNGCGATDERDIPKLPHTHSYDTEIEGSRVEATCTEKGQYVLECRCGETLTVEIPALGHDYIVTHADATCVDNGSTTTTCSRCDYKHVEIIPATGHTSGEWEITKPATDLEAGEQVRKCVNCGTILETQEISKLPHTCEHTTLLESQPATCTTDGYELYQCRCGLTDRVIINKTNHANSEWVTTKEPTYTEMGEKQKVCKDCHAVLETEYIDVIPHEHNYEVVSSTPATCTEAGTTVMKCSICGNTKSTVTPATGHMESAEIIDTPATCTSAGSKHTKCTVCGITMKTEEISSTGHTEGSTWIVDTPATCTEDGSRHTECTVCHTPMTTETIPATGHTMSDWTTTTPATCEGTGTESRSCACGYSESRTIPALGHDWSDWIEDSAATEESAGSRHKECSRCDATTTEEIPQLPPHVHEYTVSETVGSTCTTEGHTTYTCSCGDTYTETIAKTAHTPGDWTVQTAATEDATGLEVRKCTVCGEITNTRVIDKLPHTHYYTVERQEATCTEDGYEIQTCACGSVINTVLPATGHTYGNAVVVDPTCTKDGSSTITCTVCDHKETTVLPATGHNYVEVERKAATCTEAGSVTYECSNCHDTYTETVEKLEHEYVETSTIAPTCTEKGYTIETCKHCGDTKHTNETEALGHEEGEPEIIEGTITPFTGYYTPGTKEVKCSRCGVTLESTPVIPEEGTPYDDVDSIYAVYCGKDSDGNEKYTYVVGHYDDNDAMEMFNLVNQYRVENGKTEYEWTDSERIEQYIETRAKEIAVLYDHVSPSGSGCMYSENIAMSTIGMSLDRGVYHASTEEIFNAWIESEGHRNNILGFQEKTCIKVFYLKKAYIQVNGEYRYDYEPYWVEEFYTHQ